MNAFTSEEMADFAAFSKDIGRVRKDEKAREFAKFCEVMDKVDRFQREKKQSRVAHGPPGGRFMTQEELDEILINHQLGTPAKVIGRNLCGLEFRRGDFRGSDFRNDLYKYDLSGAIFEDCNMGGCDLSNCVLGNGSLYRSNLRGSNLQRTWFGSGGHNSCTLRYCDMRGSDLRYAHMSYCYLDDVDLRDCDLRQCLFRGSDLLGCKGVLPGPGRADRVQFMLVQRGDQWRVLSGHRDVTIPRFRKHIETYKNEARRKETTAIIDYLEALLEARHGG